MIFRKLIVLSFISLLLTSCGDDDCTQSDWIGTYMGTELCSGESLPATVRISASGADLSIVVDNSTSTVTIPTVTPDLCTISGTFSDQGVTLDLDGTLDGDDLSITTVFLGITCSYTLTRN